MIRIKPTKRGGPKSKRAVTARVTLGNVTDAVTLSAALSKKIDRQILSALTAGTDDIVASHTIGPLEHGRCPMCGRGGRLSPAEKQRAYRARKSA